MGVSRTSPPVIFRDNDQTVGIEADFARALAEELGLELRFVPMYFPNLIDELRDGRIDIIMSGMSVTPERRQKVAFTSPYMTIGQQALVRRADFDAFGSVAAIRQTRRTIGVESQSTGEQFVRDNLPHADRVSLPTLDAAFTALVEGGVDVVIHDSTTVVWMANQHTSADIVVVPGTMTEEHLAWAIAPGNSQLIADVNRILAKWNADGKVKQTIDRWLTETNEGK